MPIGRRGFWGAGAIALALLTSPGAAEPSRGGPRPGLAGDVDILFEAMATVHPHPFRRYPRAELEAKARDLSARIDSLPEARAALELQSLLALVGDGHTEWVRLPPSLRGPGLRLHIRRFADGWFVTTGHTDHLALFGYPIVAVGGLPIEELADRLRPFVAADNPGPVGHEPR